jgi:hypothetical protein
VSVLAGGVWGGTGGRAGQWRSGAVGVEPFGGAWAVVELCAWVGVCNWKWRYSVGGGGGVLGRRGLGGEGKPGKLSSGKSGTGRGVLSKQVKEIGGGEGLR